jgi:hypothetical protein
MPQLQSPLPPPLSLKPDASTTILTLSSLFGAGCLNYNILSLFSLEPPCANADFGTLLLKSALALPRSH